MNDAATLLEIESIKRLKARYCRLLDTKDWQAWRGLFADDFVGDTSEAGGKLVRGADAFVAFTRKNIGKASQPTVHQVHAPEIELTSATTLPEPPLFLKASSAAVYGSRNPYRHPERITRTPRSTRSINTARTRY